MILDLPLYEMAMVHSSIDKRMHDKEEFAKKCPDFKLKYDDGYGLFQSIRSAIERQAPEGTTFKRAYTGGE